MGFHGTQLESFLLAMLLIFSMPYLLWRTLKTDYFAPMVVVQLVAGVLLGPGVFGAYCKSCYESLFTPITIQSLGGISSWAVMLFVFVAGLELDLRTVWQHRRESAVTAGLALCVPLSLGLIVGYLLAQHAGWIGPQVNAWQFILAVGMTCAITSLPILIVFLEKMELLRQPLGQRVLRYASLDDVCIWSVLAVVLMDFRRLKMQLLFLVGFGLAAYLIRRLMAAIKEGDRWFVAVVWLILVSLAAESSGLHFMVGAFMAGAVLDTRWFGQGNVDMLRYYVLTLLMPVYFLVAGLKTNWALGGVTVLAVAGCLLLAAVAGKLIGVHLAGRVLNWAEGEAKVVGWLLQTKSLITIVFGNILLDKGVITHDTFTAVLVMSLVSSMLTVPIASSALKGKRWQPDER